MAPPKRQRGRSTGSDENVNESKESKVEPQDFLARMRPDAANDEY